MSEQPEPVVEQACDAGADAITQVLRDAGAETRRVVIMLQAENVPNDEGDCTMIVQGFEDPDDVLAMIAMNTTQYAEALGLRDREPLALPPG